MGRIWKSALGLLLLTPTPYSVGPADQRGAFVDRLVTVDGLSYKFRVYVPAGWTGAHRWPVILALHGGGGYGSDGIKQTSEGLGPAIERHPTWFPALVVFPQSPANGTPGWQEIGGKIALAALDSTINEFAGDKSRVSLTGLSIGGNGVWYLAYHHPQSFRRLLVICGFVAERMGTMYPILYPSIVLGAADPSLQVAQKLASIPIWMFHGDADRTVSVENSRRLFAAFQQTGAAVRYTELPGIDHNAWDVAYSRADVASWLIE